MGVSVSEAALRFRVHTGVRERESVWLLAQLAGIICAFERNARTRMSDDVIVCDGSAAVEREVASLVCSKILKVFDASDTDMNRAQLVDALVLFSQPTMRRQVDAIT